MNNFDEIAANDALLTTKFYIPPLRADAIIRHQLIERLHEGLQRKLTLVCAPAGFGKTTLLSEWLVDCMHHSPNQIATAWVSLDREDNDPVRFWRYVIASLANVVAPIATIQQTTALRQQLTDLVNSVSRLSSSVILLLDDVHVIESQDIYSELLFLIDHMPHTMHIVIASRSEPPFPLARLRASQQLVELRASDLRFTFAEATHFLRQEIGRPLSPNMVAALEERTEGWAAGLRLVALSLQGRKDLPEFISTFTGTHRYIVDYLVEEVLERLPEPVQTFLLSTSLLSSLCAPLCDALTGGNTAQALLEQLEQDNVFLVPLDNERRWYRYHHLFAEVLSQRLQHFRPEIVSELHRRACSWYVHNGQTANAIEHALAANDFEYALQLIDECSRYLMIRGEMIVLHRWLERIPAELRSVHPHLNLRYVWTLMQVGRWDEAEQRLQEVEHSVYAQRSAENQATFDALIRSSIAARAALASMRGMADRSIELTQQALAATPQDDFVQRSYMLLHLAFAYWLSGDLNSASQAFEETCRAGQAAGYTYIYLAALGSQADLLFTKGQLRQAQHVFQQALQIAAAQEENVPVAIGHIHTNYGLFLYEKNDLDAATSHLLEAMRLYREAQDVRSFALACLLLAHVKWAQGDSLAAKELLQDAKSYTHNQRHTIFTTQVLVRKASVHLILGDLAAVTRWAEARPADEPDQPVLWYEYDHLLLAQLALRQHRPADALALLHPLLAKGEQEGRMRSVIKICVLQAIAFQAQNAMAQAFAALTRALTLAEPEGLVRSFVDEGEPLFHLLSEFAALQRKRRESEASVSEHYIQQLLAAFARNNPTPLLLQEQSRPGAAQLSTGPLSEREVEILRLIAAGKSNQEITTELVIALSTLKTHINHIYSKLAVRSRTQAIVQAQKLQLL